MRLEEYHNTYHSYELSVNQSRVLTIVAKEALRDFPTNLPSPVSKQLTESIRQVQNAIDLAEPKSEGQVAPSHIEIDVTDTHEIVKAMLPVYLARANLGTSTDDVDFETVLYSQELVMLFAHLDAFMADTLEVICRTRPEVMKSSKKMDWKSILSCGGWEELFDHMVEKYVFQFGWKHVSDRIEFLRQELGLTIDCEESELLLIDEAESIRNIVVHNGARVNAEYIKRTGHTDLALGEFVTVGPEFVDEAFDVTRMLAGHLFIGVSEKFFDQNNSTLKGVWRRRRSSSAARHKGA